MDLHPVEPSSAAVSGWRAYGRWLKPSTIRGAIWAGFAVIFAFWLVAGLNIRHRLVELEARAAEVNARLTENEELLSTIRSGILMASVVLRDALLDLGPLMAPTYRQQLRDTEREVQDALARYVPVVDSPADQETIARLRAEVGEFWSMVTTVLPDDATIRSAVEARAMFRRWVVPRRQHIITISGTIQNLNRAAFQDQQAEVARTYRALQQQMLMTSGVALVLSLAIVFVVATYASRLERRIQQQIVRDQQNARVLQQLSAQLVSAQEDERRTIARELHDEIGQALTAIKVELAVARRNLPPSGNHTAALDAARAITDQALHTVRDLSHLLHPAVLDDLGLPAAVDWYLRQFSQRYGIRTELLQDRMDERLSPELETCAYRIIQEALTNVARHARASSCRVYLQHLIHTVVLTIEDDGIGFDPQQQVAPDAPRGLGLLGVRERVAGFKGTFRIESAPGKGTRLTVELPAIPGRPAAEPEAPPAPSVPAGT